MVSFKERVRNAIIQGASDYKDVFLGYEYLVYSTGFTQQPYYVINALITNYLHLTGVSTPLSTYEFFNKGLQGTLVEEDFSFIKRDKNNNEINVKGAVRQKVQALELMPKLFLQNLVAEESFSQKSISCSLATSDNKITMGFINDIDAKPKTLLWGNELTKSKIVDITLILKRNRGEGKFDTIVKGDVKKFQESFSEMLAETLQV